MSATIRKVKRVMTIELGTDAPLVTHPMGTFGPYKIEVTEYKDRGKVSLYGRMRHGSQAPRSISFRLYGYPQYDECPEWVLQVLSEAGWTLNKVWSES